MRFPGEADRYPRRDEVVDYLRDYADHLPADIRTSTTVTSVTRQDGTWSVRAEDGREFTARAVITATGDYGAPFVPDVPGQADFGGRVLHASDYRSPGAFAGQRVVVVGGGNSAIQIAAELGPARRHHPGHPAPDRMDTPAPAGPGPALVAQAHPPRRRTDPAAAGEGARLRARRRPLPHRPGPARRRPTRHVQPVHGRRRRVGRRNEGGGRRCPARHRIPPRLPPT
ncbi:NAD(P)-binding domain-containing protein [Streptomyces sp. NBC_00046]|uniref:NAD(P)-binding domain-containing protein n=1 Tax=unclassified Streptomyces TaxID=2593676 RepID=UPI0038671BBE